MNFYLKPRQFVHLIVKYLTVTACLLSLPSTCLFAFIMTPPTAFAMGSQPSLHLRTYHSTLKAFLRSRNRSQFSHLKLVFLSLSGFWEHQPPQGSWRAFPNQRSTLWASVLLSAHGNILIVPNGCDFQILKLTSVSSFAREYRAMLTASSSILFIPNNLLNKIFFFIVFHFPRCRSE